MLRVTPHTSAAAACSYYSEGLRREDYYMEEKTVPGKWQGKGAELLKLSGDVKPEAFAALAENRNPNTGKQLTARMNENRIVGYDFTFNSVKSLSVLHALTKDTSLLKAFESAVTDTMTELEKEMQTRVRRGGKQENRTTGNMVWAEFTHFTARPVSGIPDPALHAHAFCFNATFDEVEGGKWKAGKFRNLKRDAPYFEAEFHSRLTSNLSALGYDIRRTPKGGWEIAGVPQSVIEKFSRRTAEIERIAAAKGITDAKAKDALGAKTRSSKRRGLTEADLLATWNSWLTPEEKAAMAKVQPRSKSAAQTITAAAALDYATEKLFAKNSVVKRNELLAQAMKFSVGQQTPEVIQKEFERRGFVTRSIGDVVHCTSVDVLAEEVSLIDRIRNGRGRFAPLGAKNHQISDTRLSREQRDAVKHILSSKDQVIYLRGGAGVGKTTALTEAAAAIELRGIKVFAFAPSASASRGTLRASGFANADTISRLLVDEKLQKEVRGNLIMIDEAGLSGTRDLWRVMQIAGEKSRVLLVGDYKQHSSVSRGEPFRLIERYAGIKTAEITQIRRQENQIYKEAVAALSQGDLSTGFKRLDQINAFVEIRDESERYESLAREYMALSRKTSPPLVVSPTHAEGQKAVDAIREARRKAKELGIEREFKRLHNLQWEEVDRRRTENYSQGLIVQFHQHAKGIKRGDIFNITDVDKVGVKAKSRLTGVEISLPLENAARFDVFEERKIMLAKGDLVRITRNGESSNAKRLNNGDIFSIKEISRKGEVTLNNGAVLTPQHMHLTHGYATTSHASQSKSVENVLIAQSEASFAAGSLEQIYVSVSRAKQGIKIFTDNRQGLQEAVGNSSSRLAAVEMAGFTAHDLARFMELDGKKWADAIQSRAKAAEAKNFVENLLKERRGDATRKMDNVKWEDYVKARRANISADGKSRSKGSPNLGKEKALVNEQKKGRSFIRATEPPTVKPKAANENKAVEQKPVLPPKSASRKERAVKAFNSTVSHFKKSMERGKEAVAKVGEKAKTAKRESLSRMKTGVSSVKSRVVSAKDRVAERTERVRKSKAQAPVKKPQPVKQKTQAPVIRKGK